MQEVTEITTLIQDWLLPVAITLVALSALLLVKSLLLVRANRKAPHQGFQVFLKTLGLPLTLCILVVTLFLLSTRCTTSAWTARACRPPTPTLPGCC